MLAKVGEKMLEQTSKPSVVRQDQNIAAATGTARTRLRSGKRRMKLYQEFGYR